MRKYQITVRDRETAMLLFKFEESDDYTLTFDTAKMLVQKSTQWIVSVTEIKHETIQSFAKS